MSTQIGIFILFIGLFLLMDYKQDTLQEGYFQQDCTAFPCPCILPYPPYTPYRYPLLYPDGPPGMAPGFPTCQLCCGIEGTEDFLGATIVATDIQGVMSGIG